MNNISNQYVPMEILSKILFKLKPEDLSKMSQTSKEFNSYADYIWNHKNYDTEENRRILAELNFTTYDKIVKPEEKFTKTCAKKMELVYQRPVDEQKLKIQLEKVTQSVTDSKIENSVKLLTLPDLKRMVEYNCSSYGKVAMPKVAEIEYIAMVIFQKNVQLINMENYLK